MTVDGTDYRNTLDTQVEDIDEHTIRCRAAMKAMIPAVSQEPFLVQAPAPRLQVVETHRHLIRRRLAMAGSGLCNVSINHTLTLLVAIWPQTVITTPEHMIIAHYIASPDVLWAMLLHDDSLFMA